VGKCWSRMRDERYESNLDATFCHCRVLQAAVRDAWTVIPRNPPFLLADGDEYGSVLETLEARFLAALKMREAPWSAVAAATALFLPSGRRQLRSASLPHSKALRASP
jgi:hypothetical protein